MSTGSYIAKTALARIVDAGITAAFTKMGRDAFVQQIDVWRGSEGLTEEQILDRVKDLTKRTEDEAQAAHDRMPPDPTS